MEHHITQVPASQLTHSTASHFKSDEGMGGEPLPTKSQNTHSGIYKLTCPDCNKAYGGKPAEILLHVLMSTKLHSRPTATLPNLPSTLWNMQTPSVPSAA